MDETTQEDSKQQRVKTVCKTQRTSKDGWMCVNLRLISLKLGDSDGFQKSIRSLQMNVLSLLSLVNTQFQQHRIHSAK